MKSSKGEIKKEIRTGAAKILAGLDKIIVRFDKWRKDRVADNKLLHDRHEKRIERVETKLGVKQVKVK